MCSRTVSDTANRLRKTRKKKSSAVPYFRSGHIYGICAGLGSKGKVGVQRGRKTAGCPSSLPLPRGAARSRRSGGESLAEVQRKPFRPLGANTLTQFARPAPPVQKKVPPIRAEPACGSSCAPVSRCRKAPDSTRDKNFQENMRYPLAKYAKIGYYIQALFCMNSRMMLNDVKNTIIWRHSDYDRR